MILDSIYFKGHSCFRENWAGFDQIAPINVIIGRNNTGKSRLLDLALICCSDNFKNAKQQLRCKAVMDETSIKAEFSPNTSGGILGENHWGQHGINLVDTAIQWDVTTSGNIENVGGLNNDLLTENSLGRQFQEYIDRISKIAKNAKPPLANKIFRHLFADRDLLPENQNSDLILHSNGSGATNIIRKFITSSDPEFPRELITEALLNALNQIFASDGQFSEITSFSHDHEKEGVKKGTWEIYLNQEKKGPIPLSKSGSGLKTVLLVLLNLIVIPKLDRSEPSDYVFAFEELENNLHPALLRRLFQFIENYASKQRATFFITTHSSVALDFFSLSSSAQTIHVKHDGNSASCSAVSAHFDKLNIVSELGAKPSDLLQANGIVWVEGPSDRVYLNRWIEIITNGNLQEGRDYQCAFYGGSLLAKVEFLSEEEKKTEESRVNLLRVNPNICVVCDGDRAEGGSIKDRVRRISREVKQIPGAIFWATKGREIENYIPGSVMEKVIPIKSIPDPGQYEYFFPRTGTRSGSFLEGKLNRKTLDKTQYAISCTKHMTFDNMRQRFDWEQEMSKIAKAIRDWNS